MVILAAALAALTLAACEGKDGEKQTDIPSASAERPAVTAETPSGPDEAAVDYEDGLYDGRYDGYDFRILVRSTLSDTQAPEEPSDDIVTDALYRRNEAVKEKYGITISVSESESADYDTTALNSILAGDDAYDLVFAHSRAAFAYAVQGAAVNVLEVSSIHTDKPWWSKDIADSCTVGGKLYVLDGDISIDGLKSAMCLMFNKKLFDDLGIDYPYEMVRDGTWTFDEFAYIARKGASDLDGDGLILPENDRYGFVTGDWDAPIAILYTGGKKICDKDENGTLQLTLYSSKTAQIFDRFFALMGSESSYLYLSDRAGGYGTGEIFREGRALFFAASLGNAKGFRNMEDDFGIVPYPKFDEDDAYGTVINGWAPLALIPITVSDREKTGAITEALCAYGSREVLPAFYDVSLKTKYSRDEDSEEMIDIVKDSIVYDLGYVAGGTFQSVGCSLARMDAHNFSSYYAENESKALADLETFVWDYAGE